MGGYLGTQRALRPRHKEREPLGPTDPLAQSLDWTPLEEGGAGVLTRVLKQIDPDTLVFRPTLGIQAFRWSFLVTGLLIAFGFPESYGLLAQVEELPLGLSKGQMSVVVGILFMGVSYLMGRPLKDPRRFDRQRGVFIKAGRQDEIEEHSLNGVVALQLLKEQEKSFELNLVYKNGRRLNVVDHGDLRRLRRDARLLGRFLSVPLWDGISPNP